MRRIVALTLAGCVGGALAAAVSTGVAGAAPVGDFYTPPGTLPAASGAIVRTEPMPLYLTAPGHGGEYPLTGRLVMYTSRLEDGTPTAVTGTYVDSSQPWRGKGPRPTVVIAPGTSGQGDQCAMSHAFSTGLYATVTPPSFSANQEALSAGLWNALGARVFVTDYIGLGTPGIHTYVNRVEEAHAVLDAARAADALSGTGAATPLALWGYSQGGGAVAAAAELAPTYAPDLNIKGVWAGAPPADLTAVLAKVDGGLIGGVIGFAMNGFVARHPELANVLHERMTPDGVAVLRDLSTECIGDVILRHPFLRTGLYTKDHRSLLDNLRTIPSAMRVLDEQRIGRLKPQTPVLITSGRNDDTVPYGQARQLALDWCSKGATVTFHTDELPPIAPGTTIGNHFGPEFIDGYGTNGAVSYVLDRLNDVPIAQHCSIN
ncbi:lipase [Rhodococcus sp. D2-41]|nr:lipase family protein [Rhodococcus sp. D2-41]MDG3010293.1 lipase [Rhodococcus sp. D2-41]